MRVYVCVLHVSIHPFVWAPWRPGEGLYVRFPGIGITGSCEAPNMSTGDQARPSAGGATALKHQAVSPASEVSWTTVPQLDFWPQL